MQQRLQSIAHPLFVICLILLLFNDFYFKAAFHNALTGKLSDFCGLLVFAWFWSALIPGKKRGVYLSTALLFVLWKSPYAQPFIELFSQHIYPITRVVDGTDLWALLILPLGYFYTEREQVNLKINPIPLAFLSLFAFAATSKAPFVQVFEQPQYLLFKTDFQDLENIDSYGKYETYDLDSFLMVEVQAMELYRDPPMADEFHKVQVLKDLDLRFLNLLEQGYCCTEDLSVYQTLRDSIMPLGRTNITLKLDSTTDYLSFKDNRLDGAFKRFSNDSILLIEGWYKAGIEDSTWTFYNKKREVTSKRFFQAGELIKTQQFENGVLKTADKRNTRKLSIRNKTFHIGLLLLLIIGIGVKLRRNFRSYKASGFYLKSHFQKITAALILPFLTLALAKGLSWFVPNAYSFDFIELILESILVYLILMVLFFFIFYTLKLRHRFDLLLYLLILALGIVFVEEIIFLQHLLGK